MRYLVVGGAGFIGSNLAKELVKGGNEIVVCDNLHTGSLQNLKDLGDIEFINKSCGQLSKEEVGEVDGIFHMGVYSSSPMYKENPYLVGGAVNDFLNMLKLAGDCDARMVWASTSSVYNGNPTPWKEDMPIYVKDYYGEARYYMERLATLHYDWHGTETLGMRFFSVYGPKEEAKGKYANLVSQFLWAMKKGASPVLYGDGTQRRDFTYVSDVVNGLVLAMDSKIEHGVFNIGTGTSYSLNELVNIINEAMDTDFAPTYVENTIKGYVSETLADTSKAGKLLHFKATIDLKEGIEKLV
ncbi:MAG: NAD-dependent epimerase/dehydratase family protein [Candidatus Methanofastidiosia archaeon]